MKKICYKNQRRRFTRDLIVRTAPVAVAFAMSVFLSNAAYMFLSVAYIQMLKSSNVLVVYLFGCALGVNAFKGETVARLCVVSAGVLLASCGEAHFSFVGFFSCTNPIEALIVQGIHVCRYTLLCAVFL